MTEKEIFINKSTKLLKIIEDRDFVYSEIVFLEERIKILKKEMKARSEEVYLLDKEYRVTSCNFSEWLKEINESLWNEIFPEVGPCTRDEEMITVKLKYYRDKYFMEKHNA